MLRRRHLSKAGHKHYVACNGDYEARAALIYHVAHVHLEARGARKFFSVV